MIVSDKAAALAAQMTDDREVRFVDLAKLLGCEKSHVSELRQTGRLVTSADGKRLLLRASLERIAATADPGKRGVAERHAAIRSADAASATESAQEGPAAVTSTPEAQNAPSGAPGAHGNDDVVVCGECVSHAERRAKALADDAEESARKKRRENELEERILLRKDDVAHTIAGAVVQLRGRLELLPDVLAPQLAAEADEAKCQAMLRDEVEHALAELARAFAQVTA